LPFLPPFPTSLCLVSFLLRIRPFPSQASEIGLSSGGRRISLASFGRAAILLRDLFGGTLFPFLRAQPKRTPVSAPCSTCLNSSICDPFFLIGDFFFSHKPLVLSHRPDVAPNAAESLLFLFACCIAFQILRCPPPCPLFDGSSLSSSIFFCTHSCLPRNARFGTVLCLPGYHQPCYNPAIVVVQNVGEVGLLRTSPPTCAPDLL